MNLSDHFTLREWEASETAARAGIDNRMPPDLYPRSIALCKVIAEPARIVLGPMHVNSGYRNSALNYAIGGSKDSQHTKGEAVDLIPLEPKVTVFDLLLWIYKHCDFDQLIWEFGGAWCHASYHLEGPQRRQVMVAARGTKGTMYAPLSAEQILALGP